MFNALTAPATKPVKVVCSFFGSVQWWFPNVSRFSRWDGSGEVLLERLRRHAFDNCPYHSCLTPLPTVSQYIISDPKSLGGSTGMKSEYNTKVQEHPRTPNRIQCTFCIFLLYPNFRWRACVFRRTLVGLEARVCCRPKCSLVCPICVSLWAKCIDLVSSSRFMFSVAGEVQGLRHESWCIGGMFSIVFVFTKKI